MEFILGVLGGASATLLWEVVLRPIFVRRAVAEVMAAEVSLNLQLLAGAQARASATKLPPDLTLSTEVFESVTDRIGDLTPQLVAEVVFLYRYFFDLNEAPKAYVATITELRGYEPGTSNYLACQRELLSQVSVFNQSVGKAIQRIGLTQPMLLKDAFPWWTPRRWKRPAEKLLDMEELQRTMARSQGERDTAANRQPS